MAGAKFKSRTNQTAAMFDGLFERGYSTFAGNPF
jgi:hypothetical protein